MPIDNAPDYALLDRAGAAGIFFPRTDRRPPPAGATDERIEVEPGISLSARFYVLGRPHATVLYFHGNGEVAADHDDSAPLYHEIGLNLFVVDFRGYGRSEGQPSFHHLIADAAPVVEHFQRALDTLGFDPRRFIMGRSLGSQPALEIAARSGERFRGLIIESGAGGARRFLDRLGLAGTEEDERLAALHEAKLRSIRLPTLLIHGERDDLVPLTHAAELYDLLGETERQLVVIPDAGHNDLLWRGRQAYFAAIQSLVDHLDVPA